MPDGYRVAKYVLDRGTLSQMPSPALALTDSNMERKLGEVITRARVLGSPTKA